MSLFANKLTPTKADAIAKLRLDLDVALARASQSGLSERQIADEIESRAEGFHRRAVFSTPSSVAGLSVEKIAALIDPASVKKPPKPKKGLAAVISGR